VNSPRVSVVIPSYNRASFLPETIESVLAQTYIDYEIIVVDDGSTDDTPSVLAGYKGRITVIRQENQGLSAARNTGIRHSCGAYLAFLDSDDLFLPSHLHVLTQVLDWNPDTDIAYGQPYVLRNSERDKLYTPEDVNMSVGRFFIELDRLATSLLRGNLFFVPTVLVRRTALEKLARPFFDTDLSPYADWDMWLRLVLNHASVARVEDKVAIYRVHDGNMSVTHFPVFLHDNRLIVKKIIVDNLDVWLPTRTRQNYRVRNLKLTVQSGSIRAVLLSLRTVLFPTGRYSLYGNLLLLALVARFIRRGFRAARRAAAR